MHAMPAGRMALLSIMGMGSSRSSLLAFKFAQTAAELPATQEMSAVFVIKIAACSLDCWMVRPACMSAAGCSILSLLSV